MATSPYFTRSASAAEMYATFGELAGRVSDTKQGTGDEEDALDGIFKRTRSAAGDASSQPCTVFSADHLEHETAAMSSIDMVISGMASREGRRGPLIPAARSGKAPSPKSLSDSSSERARRCKTSSRECANTLIAKPTQTMRAFSAPVSAASYKLSLPEPWLPNNLRSRSSVGSVKGTLEEILAMGRKRVGRQGEGEHEHEDEEKWLQSAPRHWALIDDSASKNREPPKFRSSSKATRSFEAQMESFEGHFLGMELKVKQGTAF